MNRPEQISRLIRNLERWVEKRRLRNIEVGALSEAIQALKSYHYIVSNLDEDNLARMIQRRQERRSA